MERAEKEVDAHGMGKSIGKRMKHNYHHSKKHTNAKNCTEKRNARDKEKRMRGGRKERDAQQGSQRINGEDRKWSKKNSQMEKPCMIKR